jgi:hypothetical protein
MTETETPAEPLRAGLERMVADHFGEATDWTVSADTAERVTVSLPDRRLVASRRDGPGGADHWVLELAADGETVSKFGPFGTVDGLVERADTLLDSEVRYTVCCDG